MNMEIVIKFCSSRNLFRGYEEPVLFHSAVYSQMPSEGFYFASLSIDPSSEAG